MRPFRDRREAGRLLAERFDAYAANPDVIVLGLPRGGVPVAYEIATRLGVPLDVLVVRKLGVPGRPELAMGAIASGGVRVADPRVLHMYGVTREQFEAIENRERAELVRRERTFRGDRPPLQLAGKTVILVDDGLATGASMAAAIDAVRAHEPARIIGAVPVAPQDTCEALKDRADEMMCLVMPSRMYSVGGWYEDFTETEDAEVRSLLERASLTGPSDTSPDTRRPPSEAFAPAARGRASDRGG